MADDVPRSPAPRGGSTGSSVRSKQSGSAQSQGAMEANTPPQPGALPGEQPDKQPEGEADAATGAGVLEEEQPGDLNAINLRGMIRARVALPGVTLDSWPEESAAALDRLVAGSGPALTVVRLDPVSGLRVEHAMPSPVPEHLAYLLRSSGSPIITPETAESAVEFGSVRYRGGGGGAIESLLRLLNGVYVPLGTYSTLWPDTIRNAYSGHLDRLLTCLTDARSKMTATTLLYVPEDPLRRRPEQAAHDKELTQRLEVVLIHWTRQLKQVLGAEHAAETGDSSGPLEEICFWKRRCNDLSGISRQLQQPGVRRVQRTLELSQSSYLPAFCQTAQDIQDSARQAASNLSFLSLLEQPCEELQGLRPGQAAPELQRILDTVRLIWEHSPHYSALDRVTALLRKMSNEIVRLCCRSVSLDRLFQGDVASSRQTLQDCIQCCAAWKELYQRAARVHHRCSQRGWVLDQTIIFASTDTFVQRCKELIEVCDCQRQFAWREEGQQVALPCFAQPHGAALTRGLLEIQSIFLPGLQGLAALGDSILDVKDAAWYGHYNCFRTTIKQLELMMQNLISSAFETVTTVTEGVRLLDVFQHLSARQAIKRTLDRMTVKLYGLLNTELQLVNNILTQSPGQLARHVPQMAGQAHQAHLLCRRIRRSMEVLQGSVSLEPAGGEEVCLAQAQLLQALVEVQRRAFSEWSQSVDRHSLGRLEQPLMLRCRQDNALLDLNFDKSLLKMFCEVQYWEALGYEIPHYLHEVFQRREELRALRESALRLVSDYNRIIRALSPVELGLFREQVRFLDKKVRPGLTKLLWSTKGTSKLFVVECCKHVTKVQALVDEYKAAKVTVSALCRQISETLLVRLDGKTVYRDLEFEGDQRAHQQGQQQRLGAAHQDIVDTMTRVYHIFRSAGAEVQQYWLAHTERVGLMVDGALRLAVRRSLQELSRAVNGDSKPPDPLFRLQVVLRQGPPGAIARMEFSPTLQKLAQMVNSIGPQLTQTISGFKGLPELLTHKPPQRTPAHGMLEQDKELGKIQAAIAAGMTANAGHLQAYLKTWDKHRAIWEINKDPFIQRYQRLSTPVSTFDADIARYTEVANNIQNEETLLDVQLVLLDCSPLKAALVQHCNEWQSKLTQLLSLMAGTRLAELHGYLHDNATRLSRPPLTLEELGESLELLGSLVGAQARLEAQVQPIHDQFAILAKYDVTVGLAEQRMLEGLTGKWLWFQQVIADSSVMLSRQKDAFRGRLVCSSQEFSNKTQAALQEVTSTGPFSSDLGAEVALEKIQDLRARLEVLKEEDETLRHNLNIFKIVQPPSKDLLALEKDLESLQQVWEASRQWSSHWETWKTGGFLSLQTESMERTAQDMFRHVTQLSRELKDKNWDIVDITRNNIDQFRKTLPLITALRSPALRDRHWKEICQELHCFLDHHSPELTLEKMVSLGLDQHSQRISNICGHACKELAIEQGLEAVARTWEDMALDIAPYKDRGLLQLRSTEELFQALEDDQLSLSTMKMSSSARAFDQQVEAWERSLSVVTEVTETVLAVQRRWMYLENIFMGEDIRKQMPLESQDFDDFNSGWKSIMDRLHKDNNALRGTHHPGLQETLVQMCGQLEQIQRALDMYLETKRQQFPRFYFLSNDDLLEILGQSRNPAAVQPHLKKCFDNIKSLQMNKVGVLTNKTEASGMFSADGEFVEFTQPVALDKPVEGWLCDIERCMRSTLKDSLRNCRCALQKMAAKRDKWVRDWPGQMVITASQIQWTADVTKALLSAKERADRAELKDLKRKQVSVLSRYSDAIRDNLSLVMRRKLVALVTVEVHARDVLDKLAKTGVCDVSAFDWLSQLRLYWEKDVDDCVIRQTNTQFKYGYEYLGNSGRLVITPLTDRCYMTLTMALHLHRGGSPKGPAGTGKTETVKDLGKALGMYVIVVNCSEGLDYKSMGRMYSGLAQTGAWGCFDEFNRINMEVLSVVAQQILSVLSALSAGLSRFIFHGQEIPLIPSCGIFITMNPGYAGRSELPDNLKSMFRPISMVVPDSTLIAEITLFGEGFSNCKLLARKVFQLYSLAQQQLSQQDHYDFGLRALTSLLHYAGGRRRRCPHAPGEEILLLAMKDMNLAKLTSLDLPLFNDIIQDLFPGVDTPNIDDSTLRGAIEVELRGRGLQPTPFTVSKVVQLHETKSSRHATMLVGRTGSGKTVTWRTLQSSLTALHGAGEPGYAPVRDFPLNPKALSLGELYGESKPATNEWRDGVLSSLMRTACADDKPDEKWLVLDGPVDTLWIESMNSVMDDNKVLTLINGERISMPEQVSLLFEVEDLAVASPATVSRCGMVYHDHTDLGWKPYVQSWLQRRHKAEADLLARLFEKFLEKTLALKRSSCRELVSVGELNAVASLCCLYDSLAAPATGVNPDSADDLPLMVELWFIFSLIWSVGASVDEDGRKKVDLFLREMDGSFPSKDTVYEFYVDPKKKTWAPFEDMLSKGWRYPDNTPFHEIMVPTVDTVRYNFLVGALVGRHYPVLLTGPVGTGKTSLAQAVLQNLEPSKWASLTINMSSQTTSSEVQAMVEGRVEKRTKGVFGPPGGRSLLCHLDDLNMPAHDAFGSQPPLELLRLWMDQGFWYDRQRQARKSVTGVFLLGSMGPPGGGRTHISGRLQSRFNLINMTVPHESQVRHIYGSMIGQKLQRFREEMKPIGPVLTQATLELYQAVAARFLPTPAKIHYLFNLRDISKVVQGLLRADKVFHDTKQSITRLWIHECFRVFSDRLVDRSDSEAFVGLLSEKLGSLFDLPYHSICPNKTPPVFGDFLNGPRVYEDLQDMERLRVFMEARLEDLNLTPGATPTNLLLFRDAMEHITRVLRVISQPRGHMLLIGVGGSGRQSLSKMAAFICTYQVFQVEVTKQYGKLEFREDIKKLYRLAGVEDRPTVLLLSDTQLEEALLEDVNHLLGSGEVPHLYKQDELDEVCGALVESARREQVEETQDSLLAFLMERVRNNLRLVLCMSPVGGRFRARVRQYPALVRCCTMDWFCAWPREALLEVANQGLEGLDLGPDESIQTKVASVFVTMHQSVAQFSDTMRVELRRHNYVTPTHYLALVSGYKTLLAEKRGELGDKVSKLRGGLLKIDATRQKVEAMSLELEEARGKVADFQRQCEDYLVVIVQQKKEADEQQMAVGAHSEKIGAEEVKCKAMAENAQKDLDEALPALEEAMKALDSLSKKDMTEIKSYGRPPALVETVMQAVMILLGKEPTWAEAKRQLGESSFIKTLVQFDKDNISDRVLRKTGQYCTQADFQPDIIGKVSLAARSLCMWVRAMEVYGRIIRVVEPKRARLQAASAQLAEKQASLTGARAKLTEVGEKLQQLKRQYDEKLAMKEELRRSSEEMELKLDRADQLVSGLAEERPRWETTALGLEENMDYLVGDCLLAASCLSYLGPFLSSYRDQLLALWLKEVRGLQVPCDPAFSFAGFLSRPAAVRDWNLQGLPSDAFSTENGVIVTRGNRWPLMVDPQGQALKWIKNMERDRGLKVVGLQTPDLLRVLQRAVRSGEPVLLQNVQEELDPALTPLLTRTRTHTGGRGLLKLGDMEVELSPHFSLYITTKLSNPHYPPEVSTNTTIVNFAVKEQGLEAQLLGMVVRQERPELEEQKVSLVLSIAQGRSTLQGLEDQILRLLNEATGSLLDDAQLVDTLQTSKATAGRVSEQLDSSKQTEIKIDAAREGYRACAQRASILFFVLNDMGLVDPMYQFSMDAYMDLFTLSMAKSPRAHKLAERISNINNYHTYAVYRYTCRGLFEVHKLLFSLQMCTKILEVEGKLNMEEYSFFLRGGLVLNKEAQMFNPCSSWLSDSSWDHITELDRLPSFRGIMASFEQYPRQWSQWFYSDQPETAPLPGEWEGGLREFQRMLVVRSLRQDRVSHCVASFVSNNLGARFTEPPVLDMQAVLEDSTPRTPLIFVLSPGVDPSGALLQLAEASGMAGRFHALSLGQGQAPNARRMIQEGIKQGHWVFLANCHLSLSWMPELDQQVERLQAEPSHAHFRLWLSSSPHPEFPIATLQAAIKMTTEPPKGIKANMWRLYQLVPEARFVRCSRPLAYRPLLFSLCFLHSLLLGRGDFLQLGWNIPYGFNDSDFQVSESLLSLYLDQHEEVPWDALCQLIADVTYGGHVTDDWDRRLLASYMEQLFCPRALTTPFFRLSSLPTYYVPRDGSRASYLDYVSQLPAAEPPEVFGQHPNANVACQIAQTGALFHTLLSLQPRTPAGGGPPGPARRTRSAVLQLSADVRAKIPDAIDQEGTRAVLRADPSPLNGVLLQEVQRYNALLDTIRSSLVELEKGIKGLVVMSSNLEETFNCIHDARVPPLWEKAYPSVRPLASWTRDLCGRVEQLARWAATARPPVLFWLPGFTLPSSFLTAVLQVSARSSRVSVDSLSWEFVVSTVDDSHILSAPKEGVYVRGLYLQGAGWDRRGACLLEPEAMRLVCPMPTIHFRPTKTRRKASKSVYVCPCYYLPVRAGRGGRASFVVGVTLKSGAVPSDHWVKRGTALLMSLDT